MLARGEALARAAVLAALLAAGGYVAWFAVRSPESRLVFHDPSAPWIQADLPVSSALEQWGRSTAPVTSFSTAFELREAPETATLEVRAFGNLRVSLNGAPVEFAQEPNWKAFSRAEIARYLRAGRNELRVDVANLRGPALVSARLEGPGLAVSSGTSWMAALESELPRPALLADDVRPNPKSRRGEEPLSSLAGKWAELALLALAGVAFFFLKERARVRPPGTLAMGLALAGPWVLLFVLRFRTIPLHLGFDASSHAEYVQLLASGNGLPLATAGWSTYHPPLFYWLTAWITKGAVLLGPAWATLAPKVVPFLSGLGIAAISGALARRLLPERPWLGACAAVFACVLPMNIYMAAYLSNEGLHACLVAGSLLLAVDLLLRDEVSPWRVALLSLLLGLALLTKFTALVSGALAGLFIGLRLLVLHRGQPAALAARLAALVLPAVCVAGWYYARNVAEFGRPLVGNWELPGPGRTWWSQPGFHTLAYYTGFGECLVRPYLASFTSFWDGLYSTLWGDGQLGGAAFQKRPEWNYGFMSAGYLLALPATLLLLLGAGVAVRSALRGADAGLRSAFALLVLLAGAMGLSIFYMTLRLPYFGQVKASYALNTTPVLALSFALGVGALERWLARHGGRAARAALFAWLGALLGGFFLAFAA